LGLSYWETIDSVLTSYANYHIGHIKVSKALEQFRRRKAAIDILSRTQNGELQLTFLLVDNAKFSVQELADLFPRLESLKMPIILRASNDDTCLISENGRTKLQPSFRFQELMGYFENSGRFEVWYGEGDTIKAGWPNATSDPAASQSVH